MTHRPPVLGLACLILALVIIAMYIIATPSRSQTAPQLPCVPKNALDQQIRKQYGESIIGAGVTPMGILYVTVNPTTGSFTVVMRRPDGMSCIMGGGKGWASTEAVLPGENL